MISWAKLEPVLRASVDRAYRTAGKDPEGSRALARERREQLQAQLDCQQACLRRV